MPQLITVKAEKMGTGMRGKPDAPSIACVGDSITAGSPGISYTRYLKQARCRNFGRGGDTVSGVLNRIQSVLKKDLYDICILEIGTNDILLPFLSGYSDTWNRIVERITARGSIPSITAESFEAGYRKLLTLLQEYGVRIAAVSIPCLGENGRLDLNEKVATYNRIIRELCVEYRITFVDYNLRQKEILRGIQEPAAWFIQKEYSSVAADSLATAFGLSTLLSRRRRLTLTIDGVHLNHRGAEELALLLDDALGQCPPPETGIPS